jgi:sodium/bile acid cotransporter 7
MKHALIIVALTVVALGCGKVAVPPEAGIAVKQAAVAEMYAGYKEEAFADAPDVSVEELIALQSEGNVVIIDVRPEAERKVAMIPGAISADTYEQDTAAYENKKIVAYCTIGYRSGEYVSKLEADGVDAANLRGSLLSWVLEGHPVIDESGNETKRVHTYGAEWNILPEGYEGVW